MDEQALAWMSRAGCIYLSYGVESGSAEMLGRYNKNIRLDDAENAFALTSRFPMINQAWFIYGGPGENRHTIEKTADVLKRIKPLYIFLNPLSIFPGTDLYEDFKRRTYADDEIWLEIDHLLYADTVDTLSSELLEQYRCDLQDAYSALLPTISHKVARTAYAGDAGRKSLFLAMLATLWAGRFLAEDKTNIDLSKSIASIYARALSHAPVHQAYAGLAQMAYDNGDYESLEQITADGRRQFPDSLLLQTLRGLGFYHQGRFGRALHVLEPLAANRDLLGVIARCYRALGDDAKAADYRRRDRQNHELHVDALLFLQQPRLQRPLGETRD